MTFGRGAWTKTGMPANGTGYYQLLHPEDVGSTPSKGQAYLAVSFGVKALQKRINQLQYKPGLYVDGDFGPATDAGLKWAQKIAGTSADGVAGPNTGIAFYWPHVKTICQMVNVDAKVVAQIIHHESGFDPGAVGFFNPSDLGLAQINEAANPSISAAQAFDYQFAIMYCATRMHNALATYKNKDAAIVSYNSPVWADEWELSGKAPNATAQKYVSDVKLWTPPA